MSKGKQPHNDEKYKMQELSVGNLSDNLLALDTEIQISAVPWRKQFGWGVENCRANK